MGEGADRACVANCASTHQGMVASLRRQDSERFRTALRTPFFPCASLKIPANRPPARPVRAGACGPRGEMRRREFVKLAIGGGVAAAGGGFWPRAARAQQPMPVIGFLHPTSPDAFPDRL